jgi:hypothetical protein
MSDRVLVLDVGGTHVKLYAPGRAAPLKLRSGPRLTPRGMMARVARAVERHGWEFDRVSVGIPAPVARGPAPIEAMPSGAPVEAPHHETPTIEVALTAPDAGRAPGGAGAPGAPGAAGSGRRRRRRRGRRGRGPKPPQPT